MAELFRFRRFAGWLWDFRVVRLRESSFWLWIWAALRLRGIPIVRLWFL